MSIGDAISLAKFLGSNGPWGIAILFAILVGIYLSMYFNRLKKANDAKHQTTREDMKEFKSEVKVSFDKVNDNMSDLITSTKVLMKDHELTKKRFEKDLDRIEKKVFT